MAPSVVSNSNTSQQQSESDDLVLDAEIMKAIRNSLKEIAINSPSRPSRPAPGAVAKEDSSAEDAEQQAKLETHPCDYSDEDEDACISMITKASEIERDLKESLREIMVIKEEEDNTDYEDNDEILDDETLVSHDEEDDRAIIEELEECSKASSANSKRRKKQSSKKSQQIKQAIDASLADLSQHSSAPGSRQSTPLRTPRPLTPTPPPIVKKSLNIEDRQGSLRPLVIDGSSMGFAYGSLESGFCAEGIRIAYDCFKTLGNYFCHLYHHQHSILGYEFQVMKMTTWSSF